MCTDRFATRFGQPAIDNKQDVEVVSGSENGTFTTLVFKRKLVSCDPEDRTIDESTIRVIYSYRDGDPDTPTGVSYHGNQRGTKSIQLLSSQASQNNPIMPSDAVTHDLLNNKVKVPGKDTTYWCQGFKVPKASKVHHMIKYEPVIQPGHEALVHHILVYACYHDVQDADLYHNRGVECYSGNMPPTLRQCFKPIIAWAIGGGAFYYPEHVGYPFGDKDSPTFLIMETHYDNPQERSDYVDSSGIRVTVIPRRRQFDADVIEAGVSVNHNHVIPPHYPEFYSWGHCNSQCLSKALVSQPSGIKVFGTMLHGHLKTTGVRVRHFRNEKELPLLTYDDQYDFNYQEARHMKSERVIKSGDSILVQCRYKTTDETDITYGGLTTKEEMCLAYLLYYPKISLKGCKSQNRQQELGQIANALTTPANSGSGNFHSLLAQKVDWTDQSTRETFQERVLSGRRRHQCEYHDKTEYLTLPALKNAKPSTGPVTTCSVSGGSLIG
ncbi:DBH-like monooxygenase protein 1 [Lingula anatina]|uniref:DBH-like monooxygenase protein 1 n=1 Tax=Lingula anatina TaxID=7574 RepID=A0A1S3HRQ8_LINAN|nr:DBH-like monooxygenase protein 1 [Lingula anatina]|eukprot:XP_013388231.1 DBH-like monooxygenase protein 1 [Lingula anatina]